MGMAFCCHHFCLPPYLRFHHSFSTADFPVLLLEIQMISTAVFHSPVIVTLLWHAVLLKDTHDRASVHHHRHVAVMAADTRIHHLVKAGDAALLTAAGSHRPERQASPWNQSTPGISDYLLIPDNFCSQTHQNCTLQIPGFLPVWRTDTERLPFPDTVSAG